MTTNYPLIDIFSGVGCASLGFKKAGFNIVAALEINPSRCDVYEKNFHFRPIQKDVLKVNADEILKKAKLRKGSKFCVVGCPPCQSFSKLSSTRKIDTVNDPRSKFVPKFAQLIVDMMPMAIIFENVSGIIRGPGKKFFSSYVKKLEKVGYYTVYDIVNASSIGIPQNRERVVAISIRKKFLNKHKIQQLDKFHEIKHKQIKTVRDTISDLIPLKDGEMDANDPLHFTRLHSKKVLEMIKHVPKNGGSRKALPKRLWLDCHKKLKNGGAETSYGRMWWDKPSPTMTCRCTTPACGRFTHPSQNRGITLREAARFQTIPDSFNFGNSTIDGIQGMIGDGVPVDLAKYIGKRLQKILYESTFTPRSIKLNQKI